VSLALVVPTPGVVAISSGASVLVTGADGFVDASDLRQGYFVYETRFVSELRWTALGASLERVIDSAVEQDRWMGYYVVAARPGVDSARETLELCVRRALSTEGLREEVTLTSYARESTRASFELRLDGDFRDQHSQQRKERRLVGRKRRAWKDLGGGAWELSLDWHAAPSRSHSSHEPRLHRVLCARLEARGCEIRPSGERVRAFVRLEPHANAKIVVRVSARVDEESAYPVHRAQPGPRAFAEAARLDAPGSGTLTPVVLAAFDRARDDLAALRLADFDRGPRVWVPAGGAPTFLALFGRDAMIGGIQAAMLSVEPLAGAVEVLPRWQGSRDVPWRDEEPGRVVHEVHASPLSAADLMPQARYYGSLTASAMYALALAELWAWTADRARVGRLIDSALAGLRWMDTGGDLDGDGFYEYQSRSSQGLKNQGWKDSEDAIVHADGREAEPPIAMCEAQAYTFLAKVRTSQILAHLGRAAEARRLAHEASELQRRFLDRFWLEDQGYIAMGLDREKRPIRSIASDAGHCLATGIVPRALVQRVADRMMGADMFSGWGIRTLSAGHPAYNPFSYHRGSVWPVEQGTIALGMAFGGLHAHAARIACGTFEAAALFAHNRLPEVMSGHPRDAAHPFPAVYPRTCWPQAWSASAVVALVRGILGIVPSAVTRRLFVDPHLPTWLPEITLRGLRVGDAHADLHFVRARGGEVEVTVLDVRGDLDVVRRRAAPSAEAGAHASVPTSR